MEQHFEMIGVSENVLTRSSPQWLSGCSTTTPIVLDMHSLILGFCETCTIVHGITSQRANALSNEPYWHFRRSPTGWLKFERWIFRPTVCGIRGKWGTGDSPFDTQPIGLLVQHWHMWSISYHFELVTWLKKHIRPSDPDTITVAALEAIASSSGKNCNRWAILSLYVDKRKLSEYITRWSWRYMLYVRVTSTTLTIQLNHNVKALASF